MVIVVAEGAGEAARDAKQLQEGVVRDASNNVKLPDIGEFLKKRIPKYCDERAKQEREEHER